MSLNFSPFLEALAGRSCSGNGSSASSSGSTGPVTTWVFMLAAKSVDLTPFLIALNTNKICNCVFKLFYVLLSIIMAHVSFAVREEPL